MLYQIGWSYFPQNLNDMHVKPPFHCWLRKSKRLLKQCRQLPLPWLASLNLEVRPSCCKHKTRRNSAGMDLEASSPRTSFHSTRSCYVNCQGRKQINSHTQLQRLQTTTLIGLAIYPQRHNSGVTKLKSKPN